MKMKIDQTVSKDAGDADDSADDRQSFWSQCFGLFYRKPRRTTKDVVSEFFDLDITPKGKFSNNYMRGTFCGMKITLQKVKVDNKISDITGLLKSPYFLTHHFEFVSNGAHYFMKESFSFTINEILSDKSLRGNPYKINFKSIFYDLIKALQFAKTMSVSGFNITLSTVAVSALNGATSIHKIMDLSQAKYKNPPIEHKKDIAALGNVLFEIREFRDLKNSNQFNKQDWTKSDGMLLNDIIFKMIPKSRDRADLNQLPPIEKISEHAFTWNTRDKVYSFVQSVKILESDFDKFRRILEKEYGNEREMRQWTEHIEPQIVDQLNKILQKHENDNERRVSGGIISLIRKIRNLVR